MALIPMDTDILPPFDDYIFKALLTHPDAKPALMDLISAVTGREILDVEIRNNELPVTDADEKNERLDVNCVVDGGDQIDVEMQGTRLEELAGGRKNFINKYIYYITDLHSSQKSKGVKYHDLARTYQVTFVMYTVFPEHESYISHGAIRRPDGEMISDQLNMVIIELSKLGDVLKKPVCEMTPLEMWSVFLGYASDPEKRTLINEIISERKAIDMSGAILTAISKDEHERAKIMSQRKFETDMISNLLTAEERGRIAGLQEGRQEGRQEGLQEGRNQMIIEMQESRHQMIIEMKKKNFADDVISDITGLPLDEIKKIRV